MQTLNFSEKYISVNGQDYPKGEFLRYTQWDNFNEIQIEDHKTATVILPRSVFSDISNGTAYTSAADLKTDIEANFFKASGSAALTSLLDGTNNGKILGIESNQIVAKTAVLPAITGHIITVDKNAPNATDVRVGLSNYDKSKPFKTIQAGIDALTIWDTLVIQAGSYSENITHTILYYPSAYNSMNIVAVGAVQHLGTITLIGSGTSKYYFTGFDYLGDIDMSNAYLPAGITIRNCNNVGSIYFNLGDSPTYITIRDCGLVGNIIRPVLAYGTSAYPLKNVSVINTKQVGKIVSNGTVRIENSRVLSPDANAAIKNFGEGFLFKVIAINSLIISDLSDAIDGTSIAYPGYNPSIALLNSTIKCNAASKVYKTNQAAHTVLLDNVLTNVAAVGTVDGTVTGALTSIGANIDYTF